MKNLILSKSRSAILGGFLLTILVISNSCTKSTDTPSGQPGANEVWLQNTAFNPATITVTVGTTVKWTNKDGFTHNVTSDDGSFHSGSMGGGAVFTFQFNTAGSFHYTCTIHPGMAGTVIVQ